MNKKLFGRRTAAAAMIATLCILPMTTIAQQTRIVKPKNKYKVQEDVSLGNKAAGEIENQFPLIEDREAADYIERVGSRLVAAIPREFNEPAFDYRFKWVNASDINAFALPGGPMYINRGMIEAAANEGEMAGVMAHEIGHVALRHATAQMTKQSSAKNTLGTLGAIFGGMILGGELGAQIGAAGVAIFNTRYSRQYETQSDMLGARIMADAGYDPYDLANMFRTIEKQGGSGGPEWMSSHPNPGNRYEAINREARYLRVSPNPIKITRDFERTKNRFREMPKARTMAEIIKESGSRETSNPTAAGRYSRTVPSPSRQVRAYTGTSWVRVNVPSNWREFTTQDDVQFAPEGAFGDQGITHGMMMGVYRSQSGNFRRDAEAYVNQMLQANSYLRQENRLSNRYLAGRQGLATTLSGRSPVTGRDELVNIYTTQLRNGQLFYAITVVPSDEAYSYSTAFSNVLNSIRFSD